MTSTGTYAWNPSTGDMVLTAFARCQIRRTELTQQHLADAATEANDLQIEFANRMPLWWEIDTETQTATAGTAEYTLPARCISIVAVWIVSGTGQSTNDRIISPVSAYDYASFPQKDTQGQPTVYWWKKTITPTITLWPVPDNTQTYTIKVRYLSQLQDSAVPSGSTTDMPARFLSAFTAGLAARLSLIYKPESYDRLAMIAERAWGFAAETDADDGANLYISPGLNNYYRG